MVYNFRQLLTWQLAHEFETSVFPLTELPAVKTDFKFHDQFLDSSASPCRNIAEGFDRFNPGEFCQFYDFAEASLGECETCLRTGVMRSYFPAETAGPLILLIARCKAAITQHRAYLEKERDNPKFKRRRPRARNERSPNVRPNVRPNER